MAMSGVVVLDKPVGPSSRQALDAVRRLTHTKRAGFAGTLDPLASGVLACALGAATRLLSYLELDSKRYIASIAFGRSTTTDDAEGDTVLEGDASQLTRDHVAGVLARFTGVIQQRPPVYSAISSGGQRLYALARRGEAVDVPEREVTIHALDLLAWEPPCVTLAVHCSKGTYIRALARDMGAALDCPAHLSGLRRTVSGGFDLAGSVTLDMLTAAASGGTLATYIQPPVRLLAGWPVHTISADEAAALLRGQAIAGAALTPGPWALVRANGELWATGTAREGKLYPDKVLGALSV